MDGHALVQSYAPINGSSYLVVIKFSALLVRIMCGTPAASAGLHDIFLSSAATSSLVAPNVLPVNPIFCASSTTATDTASPTSRIRFGLGTTLSASMSFSSSEWATASAATMNKRSGMVEHSEHMAPNDIPGKMRKLFT